MPTDEPWLSPPKSPVRTPGDPDVRSDASRSCTLVLSVWISDLCGGEGAAGHPEHGGVSVSQHRERRHGMGRSWEGPQGKTQRAAPQPR